MFSKLSGPLSKNHVLFRRLRKLTNSIYNPLIKYDWSTLAVRSEYVTDGIELVGSVFSCTIPSTVAEDGGAFTVTLGDDASNGYYYIKNHLDANSTIGSKLLVKYYFTDISGYVRLQNSAPLSVNNQEQMVISEDTVLEVVIDSDGTNDNTLQMYKSGNATFTFKSEIQKVIQEPNKVYGKNIGTSKLPSKYFSGNPYDFQGSQGLGTIKGLNFTSGSMTLLYGGVWSSLAGARFIYHLGNAYVYSSGVYLLVWVGGVTYNTSFVLETDTYYAIAIRINENNFDVTVNKEVVYSSECTLSALSTTLLGLMSVSASANFYDGQVDCAIIANGYLSDDELKEQFEYPNKFYQAMNNDDRTLFITDFRGNDDIPYVADTKNHSESNAINFAKTSLISSGNGVATKINQMEYTVSGNTTNYAYSRLSLTGSNSILTEDLQDGDFLAIGLTISNVVGSGSVSAFADTQKYSFTNDVEINYILKHDGDIGKWLGYFTEEDNSSFDVKINYMNKVQGVYQIVGHNPVNRQLKTEETGIQDVTREKNELGFYKQNVNHLIGNPITKAYIDTQWKADFNESFTHELAFKVNKSSLLNERFGCSGNYIGRYSNNYIYDNLFLSNDIISSMYFPDGYIYVLREWNHETNTRKTYINDIEVINKVITPYEVQKTFWLLAHDGSPSECLNENLMKSDLHKKILTREEKTKLYENEVAKGYGL